MQDALAEISAAYKASRANLGLPVKHIRRSCSAMFDAELGSVDLSRLSFDASNHRCVVEFRYDVSGTGVDIEVLGEVHEVMFVDKDTRRRENIAVSRDDLAASISPARLRKLEDEWAEDLAADIAYSANVRA